MVCSVAVFFFSCLACTDNPDIQYDIAYYKRDTRRAPRQIHSYVAPAIRMIADERAKVTSICFYHCGT